MFGQDGAETSGFECKIVFEWYFMCFAVSLTIYILRPVSVDSLEM